MINWAPLAIPALYGPAQHGTRIGLSHTGHRHGTSVFDSTAVPSSTAVTVMQHAGIDGTTIGILAIPGRRLCAPASRLFIWLAVDDLAAFVGQIDAHCLPWR